MYTSKHKVSPNSDPHLVVTSTQAFAGIGEYVNYVDRTFGSTPPKTGESGCYSSAFEDVLNNFFSRCMRRDDQPASYFRRCDALSVVTAKRTLATLILPPDPVTHTYQQYTFGKFAEAALQSLPPPRLVGQLVSEFPQSRAVVHALPRLMTKLPLQ